MADEFPLFMQNNLYSARLVRRQIAETWDEGVMDRPSFKVTQRGAGANFSVDVDAGTAVVQGDDQAEQGNYMCRRTSLVNVAVGAAPGSNSRYDIVVLRINDPDATGPAGNNFTVAVVAGTAATSPTVPATPNSALLLAVIGPITSATVSITTSLIHDAYTATGPAEAAAARLLAGARDNPGVSKETYQTTAPNGWLMEYGQEVSRTTFARLFAELGIQHGAGDGTTTFNLPDSRGRAAVARDNMGGSDAGVLSSSNALGTKMGTETVTLTQAQTPLKDHSHGIGTTTKLESVTRPVLGGGDGPNNFQSDSAGNPSATPHNNMQPSITVNRMIRT